MTLSKLRGALFFLLASLVLAAPQAHAFFGTSWTSCYAYTFCPNLGTTVTCNAYAYGSPGMGEACTWFVEPYRFVRCTGMITDPRTGSYGWSDFWARCF
jgi:hypothetical protein